MSRGYKLVDRFSSSRCDYCSHLDVTIDSPQRLRRQSMPRVKRPPRCSGKKLRNESLRTELESSQFCYRVLSELVANHTKYSSGARPTRGLPKFHGLENLSCICTSSSTCMSAGDLQPDALLTWICGKSVIKRISRS